MQWIQEMAPQSFHGTITQPFQKHHLYEKQFITCLLLDTSATGIKYEVDSSSKYTTFYITQRKQKNES